MNAAIVDMKNRGPMDTKSTNTITAPAPGITIIQTHPQKGITTVGITIIRTHPQKGITTAGITIIRTHPQKGIPTARISNTRNHPTKSFTKGPVIIKAMLKTGKNRNKIPGTLIVTG
jgi:hypothetical protein